MERGLYLRNKSRYRTCSEFAVEYAGEDGESNRAFFYLEADRGTMPVMPKEVPRPRSNAVQIPGAYRTTCAERLV